MSDVFIVCHIFEIGTLFLNFFKKVNFPSDWKKYACQPRTAVILTSGQKLVGVDFNSIYRRLFQESD
jgi:hypothetical protein